MKAANLKLIQKNGEIYAENDHGQFSRGVPTMMDEQQDDDEVMVNLIKNFDYFFKVQQHNIEMKVANLLSDIEQRDYEIVKMTNYIGKLERELEQEQQGSM